MRKMEDGDDREKQKASQILSKMPINFSLPSSRPENILGLLMMMKKR